MSKLLKTTPAQMKIKCVETGQLGVGCHPFLKVKPDSDNTLQIALIGHSFVARVTRKYFQVFKCWKFEEALERLIRSSIKCTVAGLSGGKIGDLENIRSKIAHVHAEIVMIDIGSNDLCDNILPVEAAIDLRFYLRNLLKNNKEIKLLVICHALHRDVVSKYSHKELDKYNQDIDDFNHFVVKMTRNNPKMVHWHHQGLAHPIEATSSDGVHPDTKNGRIKYLQSITEACVFAKKEMQTRSAITKTQWRKARREHWQQVTETRYKNFVIKELKKRATTQGVVADRPLIYHKHTRACPKGCKTTITAEEENKIVKEWKLKQKQQDCCRKCEI